MNQKNYLQIVSGLFLVIALFHLLRLVYGWEAVIGGWTAPMWFSWVGLLVAGFLGFQGWKFSK